MNGNLKSVQMDVVIVHWLNNLQCKLVVPIVLTIIICKKMFMGASALNYWIVLLEASRNLELEASKFARNVKLIIKIASNAHKKIFLIKIHSIAKNVPLGLPLQRLVPVQSLARVRN